MDVNFDRGDSASLKKADFQYSFESSVSLLTPERKKSILELSPEMVCYAIERVFREKLPQKVSETKIPSFFDEKPISLILANLFCESDDLKDNEKGLKPFDLALDRYKTFFKDDKSYVVPTRFFARELLFSDYADEIFDCSDKVIAVGVCGDFIAGKEIVSELNIAVLCEGEKIMTHYKDGAEEVFYKSRDDQELFYNIQERSNSFEQNSQFFRNVKNDIDLHIESLNKRTDKATHNFHVKLQVSPLMAESLKAERIGGPQLWVVNCAKTKERVAFYCSGSN